MTIIPESLPLPGNCLFFQMSELQMVKSFNRSVLDDGSYYSKKDTEFTDMMQWCNNMLSDSA